MLAAFNNLFASAPTMSMITQWGFILLHDSDLWSFRKACQWIKMFKGFLLSQKLVQSNHWSIEQALMSLCRLVNKVLMKRHVMWPDLCCHRIHSITPGWVVGGRLLGAIDFDLSQTNEWHPNHSQEACEEKLLQKCCWKCRGVMSDLTPVEMLHTHRTLCNK